MKAPTIDVPGVELDPEARRWTLVHYDRPWTENGQRSMHFHQRADLVLLWRQAFMALANEAKVPRLDRIVVIVQPRYRHKLANRPDVGACYPAAKAAIDGLVDHHVIPDDTPDHLLAVTFLPPAMDAGRDALALLIVEAA